MCFHRSDYHFYKGVFHFYLKKYEKALSQFKKSFDLKTEDAEKERAKRIDE